MRETINKETKVLNAVKQFYKNSELEFTKDSKYFSQLDDSILIFLPISSVIADAPIMPMSTFRSGAVLIRITRATGDINLTYSISIGSKDKENGLKKDELLKLLNYFNDSSSGVWYYTSDVNEEVTSITAQIYIMTDPDVNDVNRICKIFTECFNTILAEMSENDKFIHFVAFGKITAKEVIDIIESEDNEDDSDNDYDDIEDDTDGEC